MEQNSILFRKDGKNFLQLDCENAKELSLKWDDKTYSFVKDGEKWILELPFSTAVNYVHRETYSIPEKLVKFFNVTKTTDNTMISSSSVSGKI